jgi:hypothetical protein
VVEPNRVIREPSVIFISTLDARIGESLLTDGQQSITNHQYRTSIRIPRVWKVKTRPQFPFPAVNFLCGEAPAAASSRGLLRAGVQLLLNKAGEILKPLKGRGGKLTWTGVDQAQRA